MRITARRAIAAILVACGILVGLLFVSLNTIINKNRENIQAQLQKAMGRSVTFDSVNVGLWGGLGLSVKDLQIADDPRFAATPLIQTKDLKMEVRWLPLFLGNVEIQKLVLDEPEVQIIRNERGALNLLALGAAKEKAGEKKTPEGQAAPPSAARSPLSFLVSDVEITHAKVHYVDRSSKEPVEIRLENVDLYISGSGLTRTATIRLGASLLNGKAKNVVVEGQIGPVGDLKDWKRFPLDLQFAVDFLPVCIPAVRGPVPTAVALVRGGIRALCARTVQQDRGVHATGSTPGP